MGPNLQTLHIKKGRVMSWISTQSFVRVLWEFQSWPSLTLLMWWGRIPSWRVLRFRLVLFVDLRTILSPCYSTADTCKNCAKCGKVFKIGTNEAYNIKMKIRLGGISKIFCFCSHANMAASDKGISLKKKFLKNFLLNVTN